MALASRLYRGRNYCWHWYFVPVAVSVRGNGLSHRLANGFSGLRALRSQYRRGAHGSRCQHGKQFVRIGEAPDLRHLSERRRVEASAAQRLYALLGAAEEEEVGAGRKTYIN